MEECDDNSEDTNQPRSSPNNHQQPPEFLGLDDFLKKIKDDLVPPPANDAEVKDDSKGVQEVRDDAEGKQGASDDVASKQGVSDDAECKPRVPDDAEGKQRVPDNVEEQPSVPDGASNDPGEIPCSSRSGRRHNAFLEPIVEGVASAAPGPASSSHDLQLAVTTPSMIAMTSRTSVDSLASDQTASMQTIFQTPNWADDDSDNKLTEKTGFPLVKLSRIVDEDEEEPPPTENTEQPLATAMVEGGGPSAGKLPEGDEMSTNVGEDTPGNESNRSANEVQERAYVDLSDFDPLNAPVLLAPRHDEKVDANIRGCKDGRCEPLNLAPLVLMQCAVLQNPGLSESQQTARTLHGSGDLMQFDNLPGNVTVPEVSRQAISEQSPVLSGVEKFDQQPTSFPSPPNCTNYAEMLADERSEPPAETPVAHIQNHVFQHPELAEFQHSLNQLREHRDLSRARHLMSTAKENTSDQEHSRSPVDNLNEALKQIISVKLQARSDLKNYDIEASAPCDTKEVMQSRQNLDGMPPKQLPLSNKLEINSHYTESLPPERFDLIRFDNAEKVSIASRTAAATTAQTNEADPRYPENINARNREHENRSRANSGTRKENTQSSQSQGPKDEFEIELIKTSSEIHQIKMSSSELLQDFYDMRKTYAGEFSLGSKCVARTVAERDMSASGLLTDSRGGQGPEFDLQSQRIDSAIDLMDATIDEIQKWQSKTRRTLAERDTNQDKPLAGDVAAAKKVVEKKGKVPDAMSSSTVPSAPSIGRGRPAIKPAYGNGMKREPRPTRPDASRPMTSHAPSRNQNASGRSTAPPRRDVLASQEKRPFGDARNPSVAANKRVEPTRPSIKVPAIRLQRTPSARLGKSPTAKSARTLQTPDDKLNELKKCTASPASYLERCLALSQVEVVKAKRPVTQKDFAKPAVTTKRALTHPETPNKTGKATPDVKVSMPTTPAKNQKVVEPKEASDPQKLLEGSKKDTNLPRAATNVPVVKDGDQETLKRKNRFLSDEDIEKWVRLSTRYARCAEMGASLFTSKHSCKGDKESVKSDGSLVKTASDALIDTLMDTVTHAVKKTSRSKKAVPPTSERPTVDAAKDILNKLNVGDITHINQLTTEEKVARSINNLVRSMSKIVDSTSDKRVCWDSSLDSLPTTPAERDAGLDDVQEEIVKKSRQVVKKMTDTLIKHLGNRPDELDFKVADDIEPVTQMSVEEVAPDLRRPDSAQKSGESLKRWSDTKSNQLEVILSSLMQTHSSSSSWGLASYDTDVVPDSVRTSRHKLATLENIVALLSGIDRTCKSRENNVEEEEPVYTPRPPSMAPLPDKSKRSQKGSQPRTRPKTTKADEPRRQVGSLSNLSSRLTSTGGSNKQELIRPSPPPKSTAGSQQSKATRDSGKGSPSARTLGTRMSASSSENGSSRRSSQCMACIEKKKQASASEREARQRRRSLSNASAGSQASQASASKAPEAPKKPRLSYCDTCDRKLKKEKRAKERGETTPKTSRRSTSVTSERRERSPSPTMRRGSSVSSGSSNLDGSTSKSQRLSYCDTCDKKRRKEALAKERGETIVANPRRSASVSPERRPRSPSPTMRRGNSVSSGSSNLDGSTSKSQRLSYCDTCDKKRRKEALAKERGETTSKTPRRSVSVSPERRERSPSPTMQRGSSVSSGSSNLDGSTSKSQRFSYCGTCDEKRRKEALAKERGETTPPKRSVSNVSARSRSLSPVARTGSSISSGSSIEGGSPKKPRYSYCDTCDEKLRNQTPPATPLKDRSRTTVASWRSDSSKDFEDDAFPRPRVSFSAPLEFFERGRESPTSPKKEYARSARDAIGVSASAPTKERRGQPTLRSSSPPSKVLDLRQTDSLFSNLSASLSKDSTSDNYSSATFIIADRPSRPRVDLALPKIRHVEGTRSTYRHVLQKAFIDRLDNIIKVQSASSRVNLSPQPSVTSATSMARYTIKNPESSSADKYNKRHHIPTATEIRARMRRCCERMPTRDIFGVEISRESLSRPSRLRVAESEQSIGSLDEVLTLEDLEQSSVSSFMGNNRAFSTTYASFIQREKPYLASTKISRKIQSFIKRDLLSWDKLTNDCIQNVRKDVNILPITVTPATANAFKSGGSRLNKSEEDLLLALIAALGGNPRTRPSLLASRDPEKVAKETVKGPKKNKMYRQRDNLEQDEVVIPIDDFCSSETLLRTVNVAMRTDTEASVSPSESRSTDIESPSSSTDFEAEHVSSEFNLEQVLKSATVLSYPPSVRNMEIDSTGSSTDFENYVNTGATVQGQNVLEKVAQFSFSPEIKDSDTSTAMSASDVDDVETIKLNQDDSVFEKSEVTAESRESELVGTQPGDLEENSATNRCAASFEGDVSSAENSRTSKNDSCEFPITADSNSTMPSESSDSTLDHMFSSTTDESSESLQNMANCGVKEAKEERFSVTQGDLTNSSKLDSNESYCSIPEMLERLEMAIPFQHERFAIETNSGMSMPIVDAVTEDTWDKLAHAISHLPQEAINTGDEIYSRHHHPNLPLDVRADVELYNECQDDEHVFQNQKTGNRGKSARDGVRGVRLTKSLLSDNIHETKAPEEPRRWSDETDGIEAASGDTDFSYSDGVSLIANVSTEVCVTESVADHSLLNASSCSLLSETTVDSTSTESLATKPEETEVSTENEILVSLLDQVNTRSQLAVLNSRIDGVVRREQLVEEVVEPRVIEWRGTISALCLTFGVVVAGAIMRIPSLWE